jgi:hypothetical protein
MRDRLKRIIEEQGACATCVENNHGLPTRRATHLVMGAIPWLISQIKEWQDKFTKADMERNELKIALAALVKKIDEINNDSSYRTVWELAFSHGHRYDGPQYDKELDVARNLLE